MYSNPLSAIISMNFPSPRTQKGCPLAMAYSPEVVPPPLGLDLAEVATDAGLQRAIAREGKKFQDAEKQGRRLTLDEIRLISYLAGEVIRRIATLGTEEKEELENIRDKAEERETEWNVRRLVSDIEAYIALTKRSGAEIPLARISELEIRLQGMKHTFAQAPKHYLKYLTKLNEAMAELDDLKKRGLKGFEELDE